MELAEEARKAEARKAREALEFALVAHYGERRLHIREGDDLEETVKMILDRDLGDYCWSVDFDASFVQKLSSAGFLTICTRLQCQWSASDPFIYVLLPKLHRKRSVLCDIASIHVDRGARKRSRGYHLTVDADYDGVVAGCIEQHGESWLWPPILNAFSELRSGSSGACCGDVDGPKVEARILSVELWGVTEEGEDAFFAEPRLLAGELGFLCGAVYMSLTGFRRDPGAGTVQLLALGGLLLRAGVQCWDLGMDMGYKGGLGAVNMNRPEFVVLQRRLRLLPVRLVAEPRVSASDLIDGLREAKRRRSPGVEVVATRAPDDEPALTAERRP